MLASVRSSTWDFMSVMACMTVIWMIWFIMSLVSAVLSMVWFWSWVTIRSSISSKDSVLLASSESASTVVDLCPTSLVGIGTLAGW